MAGIAAAARCIDVDLKKFEELLDRGLVERKSDGEYDLHEVYWSYVGHLRRVIAGVEAETVSEFADLKEKTNGYRS